MDEQPIAAPGARPRPPRRDWNVVATALEGQRDALRLALKRLGAFRGSGYRNLLLGHVPDPYAFLEVVRDGLAAPDSLLARALGKLVPIDRVVPFTVDEAVETLTAAAADAYLDRLMTGTFFVRLERRGLKGTLHSSDVERAVGANLYTLLERRGAAPRVDFADPDHVVAIETVDQQAGLVLLPRALSRAYPFIRVR